MDAAAEKFLLQSNSLKKQTAQFQREAESQAFSFVELPLTENLVLFLEYAVGGHNISEASSNYCAKDILKNKSKHIDWETVMILKDIAFIYLIRRCNVPQ